MQKIYTSYWLTAKPFRLHRSVVPPWVNIAFGELNQSEIAGDEDNPRIKEYLSKIDLTLPEKRVDEIAWCSAFINWIMWKGGFSRTNSGLARSWLEWGQKLSAPTFGAITILKRGNKPWMGHVGILLDCYGEYLSLLGGNQKNRVGINVYPVNKVLGYRYPKEG